MKILIANLILAFCTLVSAQDNIYYYGVNGRITDEGGSPIYQHKVWLTPSGYKTKVYVTSSEGWKKIHTERTGVKKDGQLNIRFRHNTFFPHVYKRYTKEIGVSQYYFRDEKGKDTLRMGSASSLVPLHLHSVVTEYYKGGGLKSKAIYHHNELQSNENWNEDGTEYINNYYYSADQMPIYLNGHMAMWDYVLQRMKEEAFPLHEVEDEIIVGGVVMENGRLEGVRILKGKVKSVNAFFTDVFSNLPGKWQPAELNGEVVRCFIRIPINLIDNTPTLQNVELTSDGQIFWYN